MKNKETKENDDTQTAMTQKMTRKTLFSGENEAEMNEMEVDHLSSPVRSNASPTKANFAACSPARRSISSPMAIQSLVMSSPGKVFEMSEVSSLSKKDLIEINATVTKSSLRHSEEISDTKKELRSKTPKKSRLHKIEMNSDGDGDADDSEEFKLKKRSTSPQKGREGKDSPRSSKFSTPSRKKAIQDMESFPISPLLPLTKRQQALQSKKLAETSEELPESEPVEPTAEKAETHKMEQYEDSETDEDLEVTVDILSKGKQRADSARLSLATASPPPTSPIHQTSQNFAVHYPLDSETSTNTANTNQSTLSSELQQLIKLETTAATATMMEKFSAVEALSQLALSTFSDQILQSLQQTSQQPSQTQNDNISNKQAPTTISDQQHNQTEIKTEKLAGSKRTQRERKEIGDEESPNSKRQPKQQQ
eukprot:TRINITY_DN1842_c0_g6_i2.p1 TRINITY_DN1842_c0_g6~~TRINITY_DN1842_c0_g6_i2.p1  ORF type:complete len:423 (-),score=158.33 TRINITY_DN1842_c0_g6_i2:145-1413(-)